MEKNYDMRLEINGQPQAEMTKKPLLDLMAFLKTALAYKIVMGQIKSIKVEIYEHEDNEKT